VVPIFGYLYFQDGKVPTVDSDIIKGGLSLGMVVGQLLFGVLSDVWGRHTIYGKELALTIFGTLMVVLLPWNHMSAQSVTAWVAVFRVVTGVGIGAGKSCFMRIHYLAGLTRGRLSTLIIFVGRKVTIWFPCYAGVDSFLKYRTW
jgi:MFS family permease